MAFWIEIHCDTSRIVRDFCLTPETPWNSSRCHSDTGAMAGAMARSEALAAALAREKALASGWRRLRGIGWACPHCITVLKKHPELREVRDG